MQTDHIDSKAVLWASVLALMVKNYGRENLNRLAREAKIGPGTASRLKAQETSVGLDTIDKLAAHFNVETTPIKKILPNHTEFGCNSIPHPVCFAPCHQKRRSEQCNHAKLHATPWPPPPPASCSAGSAPSCWTASR